MAAERPLRDPEGSLDKAFDAFCEAWIDGERPDPDTFCHEHPECGEALRERIEEFIFVKRCLGSGSGKGSNGPATPLHEKEQVRGKTLGDFTITREIGRGGMGVVYEAEQIS